MRDFLEMNIVELQNKIELANLSISSRRFSRKDAMENKLEV